MSYTNITLINAYFAYVLVQQPILFFDLSAI